MWSDQGHDYDNFVYFVVSENPDICIWAEAESRYRTDTAEKMAGCEEAYLPYNWDLIARRYGHQYVCIAGKRDTFPQVVTSRYPVRIVNRINGNGEDVVVVHGAGHVEVDIDGEILNIVTVHTYPFKYSYLAQDQKASAAENGGDIYRAAEMKYICEQTILEHDPEGKGNWIMAGDFNSYSRNDNYKYKWNNASLGFQTQDYMIFKSPFFDLVDRMYPETFMPSCGNLRIDYMYVSKPMLNACCNVEAQPDKYTKRERDDKYGTSFYIPSDHYPIIAEFKIAKMK